MSRFESTEPRRARCVAPCFVQRRGDQAEREKRRLRHVSGKIWFSRNTKGPNPDRSSILVATPHRYIAIANMHVCIKYFHRFCMCADVAHHMGDEPPRKKHTHTNHARTQRTHTRHTHTSHAQYTRARSRFHARAAIARTVVRVAPRRVRTAAACTFPFQQPPSCGTGSPRRRLESAGPHAFLIHTTLPPPPAGHLERRSLAHTHTPRLAHTQAHAHTRGTVREAPFSAATTDASPHARRGFFAGMSSLSSIWIAEMLEPRSAVRLCASASR